jgi:hypothetical protein
MARKGNDILCQVTRRKVSERTRLRSRGDERLLVAATRKTAPDRGAPKFQPARASVTATLVGLTCSCWNLRSGSTRLHGLWNLAHGSTEPVLELAPLTDIVGGWATLEGSRGDALVEHLAGLFLAVCFSPRMASLFSFVSIESQRR